MNDRRSGTLIETAPYAVVENVRPQVDGGRFAVKRVIGESVVVTADAFSHGHERVRCVLRYRPWQGDWSEVGMEALGNDRWKASFLVERRALGAFERELDAVAREHGTRLVVESIGPLPPTAFAGTEER